MYDYYCIVEWTLSNFLSRFSFIFVIIRSTVIIFEPRVSTKISSFLCAPGEQIDSCVLPVWSHLFPLYQRLVARGLPCKPSLYPWSPCQRKLGVSSPKVSIFPDDYDYLIGKWLFNWESFTQAAFQRRWAILIGVFYFWHCSVQ